MSTLVPQLKALIAQHIVTDSDYKIIFSKTGMRIKLNYHSADVAGSITIAPNIHRLRNLATIRAIEANDEKNIQYIFIDNKNTLLQWDKKQKQFFVRFEDNDFYCKLPKFLVPIILTILHVYNFEVAPGATTDYTESVAKFKNTLVNGKIPVSRP